MSSNANHINLSNYEEYFILYMDNELSSDAKQQVENFVFIHPHLAEELEFIMNTKLPADDSTYFQKEELLSPYMKLNSVDEELLLYVDDELAPEEKIAVEEKISASKEFSLQVSLLMQTKLDASEKISHPNKRELYRHADRVVYFPMWMRVAVAVIILLFGSFYFLVSSTKEVVDNPVVNNSPVNESQKKIIAPEQKQVIIPKEKEQPALVKTPAAKESDATILKKIPSPVKAYREAVNDVALDNNLPERNRDVIQFDTNRFSKEVTGNDLPLNKTIAYNSVTSPNPPSYNNQNDPTELDLPEGNFEKQKTTRGKGFFRKVSRFIQRNTGIGTVNADNELLVGAVALKLK